MVKENIKTKLIIAICIVVFLLCICITVDYAEQITASVDDKAYVENISKSMNATVIDGKYSFIEKDVGIAKHDGKIHMKHPVIAMTGKPSCTRCARNGCAYTWRTKKYINYCPNCKHYNCLGNKHKWQSRHEQEITCFRCDSDFCVNCGKEKYSWSRKYLTKA